MWNIVVISITLNARTISINSVQCDQYACNSANHVELSKF